MKRIVRPILISAFLLFVAPRVYANVYCTQPPNTGDETLSTSCTFSPTVEGTQNGNLTVAAGTTLTVTAGQTIMWDPGYGITLKPGAQMFIAGTGTVEKGDICLADADNDGYPANPNHSVQTAGPCTGTNHPRKDMTILNTSPNTTDCNDNNAAVSVTTTCYPDADGDGVYSSNSVSVCVASCAAPSYSATPGTDCNDGNANVWISKPAGCYADLDKDSYTNGIQANTTCLNNSSCASVTKASASTDGAAVTTYTTGQLKDSASAESDCYDSSPSDSNTTASETFPGQTAYYATARADGSWAYACEISPTPTVEEWPAPTGTLTTCTANAGACNDNVSGSSGWQTSVPGCGVSGTYITDPGTCASGVYSTCAPTDSKTETRTQACH